MLRHPGVPVLHEQMRYCKQHLENLRQNTQSIRHKYGPLIGLPANNSASNFAGAAFDQVRNIAESRKTTLSLSEVMVINAQKRLVSRGDARRDSLDASIAAALADKAFGGIEFGGRYQVFGQTALTTPDGKLLARVVVMQPLSAAFFQELKIVLGKDAMIFAGTREVGSAFAQPPGPLRLTPVAPGLFTAFNQRFIGTERDLGDVMGHAGWQVVLLETAAPLLRSLRQVQWGQCALYPPLHEPHCPGTRVVLCGQHSPTDADDPSGHCSDRAGQQAGCFRV